MARAKQMSRPDRWRAAVADAQAAVDAVASAIDDLGPALEALRDVKQEYEDWLDTMPDSLRYSPTGEKLQAIVDLDLEPDLDNILADVGWARGCSTSSLDPVPAQGGLTAHCRQQVHQQPELIDPGPSASAPSVSPFRSPVAGQRPRPHLSRSPGRGMWSEPCACGRDIRVPNIPLDRAMWSEQDWASITVAVSAHQRTPEHVAYRMGYRANILPRSITLDGLPVWGASN